MKQVGMKYFCLVFLFLSLKSFGQKTQINPDFSVEKLTDHVYMYTTWSQIGEWGRVGSNGMIVVDGGKAFMCDTPMEEGQTGEVVAFIRDSLSAELVSFVPGHWHGDCVGGMAYLQEQGVETYAHEMTNDILRSKSRPAAKHGFRKRLNLTLNSIPIECFYLGGGHSTDNIVVWLPGEKILFGGCLVKDCASVNLGNTEDAAPVVEWRRTIQAVGKKFREARTIIPGHGTPGDAKLLEHTESLLRDSEVRK